MTVREGLVLFGLVLLFTWQVCLVGRSIRKGVDPVIGGFLLALVVVCIAYVVARVVV